MTIMHDNEYEINQALVKNLLALQFPQWADFDVRVMDSAGTDNKMYRLGHEMVVRLPRLKSAVDSLAKEAQYLPELAPHLPLNIPEILGKGCPTDEYPFPWLICKWLDGKSPVESKDIDLLKAATDLGNFVCAFQSIENLNGPACRRGQPLSLCDAETRTSIPLLKDEYDVSKVEYVWNECVSAASWQGGNKWIHGDLHPGNILVKDGKISAIIDFGLTGVGDPAVDLMVAWTILDAQTRDTFHTIVNPDVNTWGRGRGWALRLGILGYPYYKTSNPVFAEIAKRALDEALQG